MSATSGGSSTVVRFSDSEISKLLNLPIAEITESNQDQVSAPNANDTRKSSSQCDNQNFLPKVRLGTCSPSVDLDFLENFNFHVFTRVGLCTSKKSKKTLHI